MKRLVTGIAASLLLLAQPAAAQSILRDAETEAMFATMSRPLIVAAGLSPANVRVVLINDDSINAFVAGGQTVYVHSGLLAAADNANEVQGVIAHELGHIADGHVVLQDVGSKPALGITLLSMVVGLAAAVAGAGDAGMAIMGLGQAAGMGKFLAFSRVQESTADAAGAKYLNDSGVSGRGMLSFFKKLQSQEYAYGLKNIDPFAQSHPLSGQRIENLRNDLMAGKSWNAKPDVALEERFKRVKAKLNGFVADAKTTLNVYPEDNQSVYAHYARAYAWHKSGYPDKADAEAAALIKADPHDPYFLEIQGQILLEAGKPAEAIAPLREATERSNNAPLIATTFGHALIATDDAKNYPEAVRVLRQAVQRDDQNPFAWYQLGTVYERIGDEPRALLATAERASQNGDSRTAAYSARGAMAGLTPNTADWIRAQDIAMTAQNDMDDNPKKYRKR
ncbi:M48 family metalloprotease [Sphingomonas hylomeconis]|uniref:M48 family metalloprotease n=1 Tax=Sphingomonas hylomeconis TaxID=1395958 RepID=A0ABV7SYP5_9SPHN|nr:M48 family metalloprotease [Sphingomonas hylomeconis]